MNTLTSLKCAAVLLPALAVGMPMANASDEKRDDPQDSAKTSSAYGSERQDQSRETTLPGQSQASVNNEFFETMPDRAYHSDSLIGQEVQTRDSDDSVGEINNLVLDDDGQIVAVILSVGGTLGMGERDVAVAWDQIERRVDGDETTLVVNQTEQSLKDAPKYSNETKSSSDSKYSSGDKMHTDKDKKRHDYDNQSATASTESSAYNSDDKKSDADKSASDKSDSYAYESGADNSDEYNSDEYNADANEIESDANEIAQGQFLATAPARGFHSDNLIGQEVTNRSNNESIGEVSDLVLDENGKVIAAIISVGGVMGLGEREVAISWDQIERDSDGDEIKLTTDLSQESLEDAPKYKNEEDNQMDQ